MKHKHALVLVTMSLLLALMLPLAAPAQTGAPTDLDAPPIIDSFADYAEAHGVLDTPGSTSPHVPTVSPTGLQDNRWCNTNSIAIPETGAATPYPSTISVSGYQRPIASIRVHLLALSHTNILDVDVLLVGPQGQNLILMSFVGTGPVSNINLTFDDDAATILPFFGQPPSGSYRPTSYRSQAFPPPAPAPSSASALAVFEGTNPNGEWALYVMDRRDGDAGQLAGGWCLEIVEALPVIVVEPTELNQAQPLNRQATVPLTIANDGDLDLTWAIANSTAVAGQIVSAAASHVGPFYYHDRAIFDAVFPGLPVEDFEAGLWGNNTVSGCPAPFSALTDNACFAPGGILPGISFQDDPLNGAGADANGLAGIGAGFSGALSKNLVANTWVDAFEIVFDPPVQAAGMDLIHFFTDGTIVDITIYDSNDVEIATTQGTGSNAGTFWGVYSAIPIGRIRILSPMTLGDGAEGVDNVAFGQVGACSDLEDISWLTVTPHAGVVPSGGDGDLDATFDSTGLAPALYTGTLCISSNDPLRPVVEIPLALTVTPHLVRFPIMLP